MKPLLPACAALFLVAAPAARACTTAVISGKATKDGRPLLWKNRDASDLHNQVVYREDGRYPYLAVVNRGDRAALQVWSGINAAGFAIMNNASYNLATDGDKTVMEGAFMKLALQSCATVEDFQELLRLTDAGGREVAANFGVIDAKGGAAYFETDAKGFRRFDAAGAKGGFLVRSNYSHSGRKGAGTGFLREARAQALLEGLQAAGRLEAGPLLAEVARDTANAHIGSFPAQTRKGFAPIQDAISRGESSHAFLVQGVRPGEAPERSTAWVILGLPVTGVAVPLWVAARSVPAELAAGPQLAPMNAAFDRARRHLYPERTGTWRATWTPDGCTTRPAACSLPSSPGRPPTSPRWRPPCPPRSGRTSRPSRRASPPRPFARCARPWPPARSLKPDPSVETPVPRKPGASPTKEGPCSPCSPFPSCSAPPRCRPPLPPRPRWTGSWPFPATGAFP